MRIAVTYENGQIFQHFGHTETFKIYDVEEGKVVHSEVVDTNGSGHGALAGVLNALNADVLICGGIGGGAQTALAAAGIKLFGGVSGDADKAVEAFINETLDYNPDVKCSHHEHSHGEGHTCGEHGCGRLEETSIEETNELKITHETIANHLGSHREVITRMLRYFQGEGLVKLSRGKITILDSKRLETLQRS